MKRIGKEISKQDIINIVATLRLKNQLYKDIEEFLYQQGYRDGNGNRIHNAYLSHALTSDPRFKHLRVKSKNKKKTKRTSKRRGRTPKNKASVRARKTETKKSHNAKLIEALRSEGVSDTQILNTIAKL